MPAQDQRTLLITMGRGLLVRNFMRTAFLKTLLAEETTRLVILTPAHNDPEFLDEFSHEQIAFLDLPQAEERPIDRWFNRIQAAMVFTGTTRMKLRRRISSNKLLWSVYAIRWLCASTLGRLRPVRTLLNWLEARFIHSAPCDDVMRTYHPDLVFITSLVNAPDREVARCARQHNIPLVGMCKSWDNLTKDIPIRIRPDTLLVWNGMMEQQAVRTQRFLPREIIKTGIPQFDSYFNGDHAISRSDYCNALGIDESKKILCFASAGSLATSDQALINTLLQANKSGKFGQECQLVIRPHFCYPDAIAWYDEFRDHPEVILQTTKNNSRIFPDNWNPKEDDACVLSQIMQHADVVITSPSTLVLDRACFDKPIINIGYDAIEDRDPLFAMTSYYGTDYYREVLAYNAAWFVKNEEELIHAITRYLDAPDLHQEQRARICDDFCYRQDGKSAQRIAEALLNQLT